jgi:tRNA-dihydrouridine synthase A
VKKDFPQLSIVINGGITSVTQCQQHLKHVDGVMVGREAYHNPYLLNEVERVLFSTTPTYKSRGDIFRAYLPYVKEEVSRGTALNKISRHILGLFQGVPGAKQYRRHISENAFRRGSGVEVLEEAFRYITEADVSEQSK